MKPLPLASVLLLTAALHAQPAAVPAGAPSFNCAHVTSNVNKLICATPSLAALDRKLNDDFTSTHAQGGIDARALDADEAVWIKTVRNQCADVACLNAAYLARDKAILDQSLLAASPAAYAETQPFPAPPAAMAAAQAQLSHRCAGAPARPFAGFTHIPNFITITGNGNYIAAYDFQGTHFAFLLTYADDDFAKCIVSDVVVLPAYKSQTFLQCWLDSNDSNGFGIRHAGSKETVYWSVDAANKRLNREPLGVLGGKQPRCLPPESGE